MASEGCQYEAAPRKMFSQPRLSQSWFEANRMDHRAVYERDRPFGLQAFRAERRLEGSQRAHGSILRWNMERLVPGRKSVRAYHASLRRQQGRGYPEPR